MGVGFELGGVYTPRFAREGRPVAAPDEDKFTMAVAALEGMGPEAPSPDLATIHLVGSFPSGVDWALAAYLGHPVELLRYPGDGRGLMAATQAATSSTSAGRALVLAAEASPERPAGGVALRFGPTPVAVAPAWDGAEPSAPATEVARSGLVAAHLTPMEPPSPRSPPWPVERVQAFASLVPSQVSEGAYVPRPRYIENLGSRWRLDADRCGHCAHVTIPRRALCRSCGRSDALTTAALPRDGARVVAATTIGKGGQPTEFDAQVEAIGGFGVVLAEFSPGVRLTLQVTDASPGEVQIGTQVGTCLRRLYPMEGEWRYGRKAVPAST
jgi:uncharacterized OB-fold protein